MAGDVSNSAISYTYMESSMGKKDYGNILTTVIFSIFILAGLWTWENRGFLFGYFPHTSHYELTEGNR